MNVIKPAGWGFPWNARKAHYFEVNEILSLCGRWLYFGLRNQHHGPSPDDCAECRRRLVRLASDRKIDDLPSFPAQQRGKGIEQ
jgi:hypothetical protein